MKSKFSSVFEDCKFKISEGFEQNLSFLVLFRLKAWGLQAKEGRDRKTSILLVAFWNFRLKVFKYQWTFRPHATVILRFGDTPKST